MKILHGVFYILFFGLQLVYSQWEFAVTTQNKIIFYNEDWSIITTAAHQFEQLSAITFDESEERIYFNDLSHNNGSIFSLKLSSDSDGNHITEKVLAKTQDEAIAGLAFDPLEQNIYWTDAKNKKIYRLSTQQPNQTPTVLFDFTKEDAIPDGIAIDVCRRKLYWTNSNHKHPSIERSSLNGSKREVLINTDLFSPHGIFIDQFSNRMFWLVDQPGSHYSVESANLDGTDRQAVVEGLNNVPFSLAVTKSSIYWTDLTHSAIWNVSKTNNKTEKPSKVLNFPAHPKGVVARVHFLSRMENDADCKEAVRKIKTRISKPATSKSMIEIKQKNMKIENFCLNKGEYNEHSGTCICKVGFTGNRCEVDSCQNFCVHGTCHLSSMGFPECTCQEGFSGDRCEIFKCHDYCLNEGRCEILNDVPICHCPESHTGSRCEKNTTEVCSLHCKLRTYEPENFVPFNCWEICDEESSGDQSRYKQSHQQTGSCSSTYNKTVIFVVVGVLTSLILVYLIIQALRRIYKPARPRIKKTFVVQKKISQTPLTSRPMATEQCEITIENCCNMNICDTPCFDPKLLQQNMTFDTNTKEDKKILINNMEEDLY